MSTGGWLLVDPARLADEGQRRLLREMRAAHPDSFEHAGVVHVPVLSSPPMLVEHLVHHLGWPAAAVRVGGR